MNDKDTNGMLNYLGNLINDFASRLASSAAASNTVLDVDSNGHLSLGSGMGGGSAGGKKKKKKRRHR